MQNRRISKVRKENYALWMAGQLVRLMLLLAMRIPWLRRLLIIPGLRALHRESCE